MNILPSDRIAVEETYYFAKKLADIAQFNKRNEEKIINLGIGNPDIPPHPLVIEAMIKALSDKDSHRYQPYRGIPELREAFAGWYGRTHGVILDPNTEVLPLLGSKEGVMHISMSYINSGDEVLIPNPGYPAYAAATRIAGGTPIGYKLSERNNWQPDFEDLAKRELSKVKLMWLNYPHMPTGARGSLELFEKAVKFCKKFGILVCNDNPYSMVLNQKPVSILQVAEGSEVAIELTSLSKNFSMAGYRVGAVLGSAYHINNILKFKSNMDSGMYQPIQKAAITALSLGTDWTYFLNKEYSERRSMAYKIMDLLGCTYEKETSGLFVWAKIPTEFPDANTLSEHLQSKAKVFITPGHIFGSAGERYLRISLCTDVRTLVQAKGRIEQSIKS